MEKQQTDVDYLFTTKCEDCSDRAAYAEWENWCNGYIVTRFKCRSCQHDWDDIWQDITEYELGGSTLTD